MNTDKNYNGWTNYETWVVNLWMDNDEGSQTYWMERARDTFADCRADSFLTRAEEAAYQLAKEMQENHEEALPELHGFAADLLNAAMSEVNWHEIAKGLIEEAAKALADS